jgi:uncharacterized circularly permuted ATP-grasp superfamily protein/uncharacterized alpha-E superfamily protein
MNDVGPTEFLRRWREAQQIIRENGVTYNVYGDPKGMARPWKLDPIPLLISPADAEFLESGVIQRGLLLEKILHDLYGEQRLLKEGLLPPELVFGNPGFWRPCHGVKLPGERFLHLYATNLGRTSAGEYRVLGDRAQAPSGAGYALENRIIMSRTLPEAFRDCRVQRLANFFRTYLETLRSIAPRHRDNPRIVLLTPGPKNATYFEQAYLARYLGISLVEGGDLTVRDHRVYLKVLGGLQQVDVVLRRLDVDLCDPLELRADSLIGVPGLVSAVRAGNVAVANALGSGAIETPAMMPYLPKLCRHFFGEDLRIASVPTWWCGQAEGLKYVLEHLDSVVIKAAYFVGKEDPIIPSELSAAARASFLDQVRAHPRNYVAQEKLSLSTAPVMVDGQLQPRRVVLRTYIAASSGGGFHFMPGGLTRVSGQGDSCIVTMRGGAGSKDTWVLASGAVNTYSMLRPSHLPVELNRGGGDLPSRSADNLFWLGRYAERAEGTVRLLRGVLARLSDRSGVTEIPEMPALIRALALHSEIPIAALTEASEAAMQTIENQILKIIFDASTRGSLAWVLSELHRVTSSVRDRISIDMWRAINDLTRFPQANELPTISDILELLNRTIITLSAFGGMAAESMTRSEGKLERSLAMANLLKGTLVTPVPVEGPVLEAILEVADSSMTYRRRYMGTLHVEPVLDLLVFDETNPRSLAAQLVQLSEDVDQLPRQKTKASLSVSQLSASRKSIVSPPWKSIPGPS